MESVVSCVLAPTSKYSVFSFALATI
jgi:hypothetical protein